MQPLDSISWTGVTPIIQELPAVWDERRAPLFERLTLETLRRVPAFGRTQNYAATRYSWTRPPNRSARWTRSTLVNVRKVE